MYALRDVPHPNFKSSFKVAGECKLCGTKTGVSVESCRSAAIVLLGAFQCYKNVFAVTDTYGQGEAPCYDGLPTVKRDRGK